jgi:GT2 family glycosyltransferase
MLTRLALQTRIPDRVIVVGVTSEDVAGVTQAWPPSEILLSAKGSCRQRNAALDLLTGEVDVVLFIDDDFVAAPDYLEQVERLMRDDSSLVGLTGHLLADGAHTGEISIDDAVKMLESGAATPDAASHSTDWLYGCNMAVRFGVAPDLRFDENLPLYGWQEDVDFSCQLGRLGKMVRSGELTGIHLGTKSGRTSGLRFGYSQVANIVYLRRKGTITLRHGYGLMARNIVSNAMRSLWPEPQIDRRGRLLGNALAFLDCLRGRVHPRRIESL